MVGALEGGARLVSLVGAAGVGKSRLALEVCARLSQVGEVVCVPLGSVRGAPGLPRGGRRCAGAPPHRGGACRSAAPRPVPSRADFAVVRRPRHLRRRSGSDDRHVGRVVRAPARPRDRPTAPRTAGGAHDSRWSPSTMTTRSRCSWRRAAAHRPRPRGGPGRWCASSTGCRWRSSWRRRGRASLTVAAAAAAASAAAAATAAAGWLRATSLDDRGSRCLVGAARSVRATCPCAVFGVSGRVRARGGRDVLLAEERERARTIPTRLGRWMWWRRW